MRTIRNLVNFIFIFTFLLLSNSCKEQLIHKYNSIKSTSINLQFTFNKISHQIQKSLVNIYVNDIENGEVYNGFVYSNQGFILSILPKFNNYDKIYAYYQKILYHTEIIYHSKDSGVLILKIISNGVRSFEYIQISNDDYQNFNIAFYFEDSFNEDYIPHLNVINKLNSNSKKMDDINYFYINTKFNCQYGCTLTNIEGEVIGISVGYINFNNIYETKFYCSKYLLDIINHNSP